MKDRVKKIRKEFNLSQSAFAESLNLSGNFITLIEGGTRNLSDRTISDICRVYNVNEEWLRTGNGEMYRPKTRETEIAEIAAALYKDEDNFKKNMVSYICEMTPDQIELLKEVAKKILDE